MKIEPTFVNEMVKMYLSGIEQQTIANKYDTSLAKVRYWLKKKGVYDQERWIRNNKDKIIIISSEKREQIANKAKEKNLLKYKSLYAQHGFVLEEYNGTVGKSKFKCLTCGDNFERTVRYWNSLECPCCKRKKRKENQIERQQKSSERHQKIEDRKKARKEEKYHRLFDIHVCPECLTMFTIKDYMKREQVENVQFVTYCSKECRRKHDRRKWSSLHGKHKKRANKYNVEYDGSVTLDKLIKKFGLTCSLCGEKCDTNDYVKRDGAFVYGDSYPSIDHIIPMVKGGCHTWDNVQVAHRRCNSVKIGRAHV